jgi:hypothetical protein
MFARLMGLNVISPGKLQQLMQKQPVSVLDVNSRQSWLTARVPGARPLDPMGYDESDLPADRDSTLVFYCSNFLCRKAAERGPPREGHGIPQRLRDVRRNQRLGRCFPADGIRREARHLDFQNAHREIPRRCSGQV